MARGRPKKTSRIGDDGPAPGLDVNAVVSYNLRWIREREQWTQQAVAMRLGQLTGHELPAASISAMERGFDGDRRRRFDAHELYLLSVVFDVPIAFFFIPPPNMGHTEVANTRVPVSQLYAAFLGSEHQLRYVDERLREIGLKNPEDVDAAVAGVLDIDDRGGNWHTHFRSWRKRRLVELSHQYADRLNEVAEVLAEVANGIQTIGPAMYLQMAAHKHGEDVLQMTEVLTPEEKAAAEQRARQAEGEFEAQVGRSEPDDE
jgi:transcriptional regulator with XRE-family HTH domain